MLIIYLFIINAAGFLLMHADKQKAIKNRWRIPERTLLITAILGGSLGVLSGIYIFRHKTRHLKFSVGVPVILAVQILIAVIFLL